jgi:hypothetical protein
VVRRADRGGGLSHFAGTTTLVGVTVTGNFAIGGLSGDSGAPGLPVTQLGSGGSGGKRLLAIRVIADWCARLSVDLR